MFVLITIVSSFCSSNSVLKVSFSAHASIGLQVPARHRKPVAGDSFLLVCTSDDFWAIPSYTAVAPSCSNRALLWRFCPDMHPSHGLGQQPTDRPTVTLHLSGKKILFSHSSDRIVKPPFSSHFTRHFRNKYSIKRAGIIIIFFFFYTEGSQELCYCWCYTQLPSFTPLQVVTETITSYFTSGLW